MKSLIKTEKKLSNCSKDKVRFFKTSYLNKKGGRMLLTNNTKGNFCDREWVIEAINQISDSEVIEIYNTIEISEKQYHNLMLSLPDTNSYN